jgi:uncharacterized protein
MKISLETGSASNIIRSYDAGCVAINEEVVTRSVVVMPEQLIRDWPPQSFEELRREHFDRLSQLHPEIVLVGTGERLRFPEPRVTAPLRERGIGVEVMDTAAACRTYNVLMAEGRVVAAALLMI